MNKKVFTVFLILIIFVSYSFGNKSNQKGFGKYIGPSILCGLAGTIPVALIGPLIVPDSDDNGKPFGAYGSVSRFLGASFLLGSSVGVTLVTENKIKVFGSAFIFNAAIFVLLYKRPFLELFYYDLSIPFISAAIATLVDDKSQRKPSANRLKVIPNIKLSNNSISLGISLNFY